MVQKLADKFLGNKPLEKGVPNSYPDTMDLHYNKFEPPKEIRLVETVICQKIEKEISMVFGIAGKEEKLIKYDFLYCTDGGASELIVHNRVLAKLELMCPDDFQVIPVIIKNYKAKDEPFENRDFVLINVLHLVDAIDKEKTKITYSVNGVPKITNVTFREDCMEGHLLARDRLMKVFLLFDPKLAREFVKSKGIDFKSDIYLG